MEKTEAVVDCLNPTFEQELCLFVDDPVNNTVQLTVHQVRRGKNCLSRRTGVGAWMDW